MIKAISQHYTSVTLMNYETSRVLCKVHLFEPNFQQEVRLLNVLSIVHYMLEPGHFFHSEDGVITPLKSSSKVSQGTIFYLPRCKTSGGMRKSLVKSLDLPPGVSNIIRGFLIPVRKTF